VTIPGEGHSQPVLWGDKLFVTSAVGEDRAVLCLSAHNGQTVWSQHVPSKTHGKHKFNSFASSTPCCDAERVYVTFASSDSYTVTAFDHAGNKKWHLDLGPFVSQHSMGASPMLYKESVIVCNEQDGPSSLVAIDRTSGKIHWRATRRTADQGTAYSTPCIYEPAGEAPQLIVNSKAYGVSGVDPETGKTLWESPLLTMRSCSSPVFAGGIFTGSTGSGGGGNYVIAIRPGGAGDVSKTHLAWTLKGSAQMPYVCTPVAHGDLLFLWSDKGFVTCVDAKTGEQHWQQRVGGNYFGSPIRVQDRLYCLSTDGQCVVLAASTTFKELARIDLGEASHNTPAIAGGRMYLRTFTQLMSVGGKK
jgi:outer membrane protein assembly factor BamB